MRFPAKRSPSALCRRPGDGGRDGIDRVPESKRLAHAVPAERAANTVS
jgi:hypothetical protein